MLKEMRDVVGSTHAHRRKCLWRWCSPRHKKTPTHSLRLARCFSSAHFFFLAFGSRRFHFSAWQKACPTIRRRRSIGPSADAMAVWLSVHEACSTLHRKMPPVSKPDLFLWLADLSEETIGQPVACLGQPEMTSRAAKEKRRQAFFPFYTPI